jgi:hypothetical protein
LTSFPGFTDPHWNWLRDSLIAELRFRGLVIDFDVIPQPEEEPEPKKRSITFED